MSKQLNNVMMENRLKGIQGKKEFLDIWADGEITYQYEYVTLTIENKILYKIEKNVVIRTNV